MHLDIEMFGSTVFNGKQPANLGVFNARPPSRKDFSLRARAFALKNLDDPVIYGRVNVLRGRDYIIGLQLSNLPNIA
jgi:hypothetical protein